MIEDMMRQTKTDQSGQVVFSPRQQIIRQQQGVALIISMILLAVITLLSVTAMRGTNLDARIAANYQHKQLSFQAAENAFAKLTGDNPQVTIPTELTGILTSTNYVSFPGVDGQPANSADLDLTFMTSSEEYRISGYSAAISVLIYQADALGAVDGSKARSHNRVTVALVRPTN